MTDVKHNYLRLYDQLLMQVPLPSDALVWLQGDRFDRGFKVLELFKQGWSELVVLSGNNQLLGPSARSGEDNLSLADMRRWLIDGAVPSSQIIIDDQSFNTKEQSINILQLAMVNNWQRIIIVSSAYYQPRVFLTFLKTAMELNYVGQIIHQAFLTDLDALPNGRNATARQLLELEADKVAVYQAKGDLVDYEIGFTNLQNSKLTSAIVKLRPATNDDAELLLDWRNEPLAREFSHNTDKISSSEHRQWLATALTAVDKKIFIAELNEVPIGTVRWYYDGTVYKLSWLLASEFRGRGLAKAAVSALVSQITGPISAEIKLGNEASIRIAEHVHMLLIDEKDGVLYYYKS